MVLQTAIASSSADPLGGHLVQAAVILILALQGWCVRAVLAATSELTKMRQTLFGETGDNGINGTQKKHADCLTDHEHTLAEHTAYIENTVPERLKLWEAFKERTEGDLKRVWEAYHRLRNLMQDKQRLLDQLEEDRRHGYGRRIGDHP